jgi:hypothetical protein
VPRGQVEGVVGFYGFFSETPRGRYRVLFSDNITDELAGSHALRQRLLDAFERAARRGQPRRPGVDRRDELHRPVRSRAGAPGQRPRDRPPDAGAHRRDRVAHPRRHAGRAVARQPVRDRSPRPSPRPDPRHGDGAGRRDRRDPDPRRRRHRRDGRGLGAARPRRRRLLDRAEVGGLRGGAQPGSRRALRRVQRRRGRARDLQGPRASGPPRRPGDRGHDRRRPGGRRDPRAPVPARRVSVPGRAPRGHPGGAARAGLLGPAIGGAVGFATSTSSCTAAPAPTCAARSRRCSSRSRASAASRATARRIR